MKKTNIPDSLRWKEGFELLEEFRRKEIRESTIVKDAPVLQSALDSAIFLNTQKKETGLGKLGILLKRMSE